MKAAYSTRIKLVALTLDPMMQGRVKLDTNQFETYAEAMRDGAQFPPITVVHVTDTDHYYVVDGWHRVAAARDAGLEDIDATVSEGTYQEAFLTALGANATHGLPRTNADKNRIAQLALMDAEISKLSDRKISELLGLSQPFVSKLRAALKQTADNGYQPTPFDHLVLTMDEIGHVIMCQGKSHWIMTKESRKLLREGLLAGDQQSGYRATRRGVEYIEWLKEYGHERIRFEIKMYEFAQSTHDPKYRWNDGWEELEKLWRARGWRQWGGRGSLNALVNIGYALMETINGEMWVHISAGGCRQIDAQVLEIAPLPEPKPGKKQIDVVISPEEIEHRERTRYETQIKWTKDRAIEDVKALTKAYWCKDFYYLYPELRLIVERAQQELLTALAAAQPIPFVPSITDEAFDTDAAFEAIAGD